MLQKTRVDLAQLGLDWLRSRWI